VVGGAGSLAVAPGFKLAETPPFPAAWKPVAQAHAEPHDIYRMEGTGLEVLPQPGGTGSAGGAHRNVPARRRPVPDRCAGRGRISAEDYANAFLDEVAHPRHIRQRITMAYQR
jgi:putative NADH-flavin reductase